ERDNVWLSVVIKIRDVISHAEITIMAEMFFPAFSERTITIVDVVVIVFIEIISYVYIIPPIIVQVGYCESKAVTKCTGINAGLIGYINESTACCIQVIAVKFVAGKLVCLISI